MSVSTSFSVDGQQVKIPPQIKKVHVVRETGETVLHKASRQGLKDVVLWCCQTRYVNPCGQDYAGFAPMHESCATCNIEITKILLAYGADVNVASLKDGIRPLHDAVESDHIEMVRLLLSCGAETNIRTFRNLSIWDMIRSNEMREFLTSYFSELNDDATKSEPWEFCDFPLEEDDSDDEELGQDLFADVPSDDDDDVMVPQMTFECSEHPLIPTYRLSVLEAQKPADYVLLLDILERLGMSKMDFTTQLRMSIFPLPWFQFAAALTPYSVFTTHCKWIPADERKRKFPVDLVKWDERLQDLLGVNVVYVKTSSSGAWQTSHTGLTTSSEDDMLTSFSDDEAWSSYDSLPMLRPSPRPLSHPPPTIAEQHSPVKRAARPLSVPTVLPTTSGGDPERNTNRKLSASTGSKQLRQQRSSKRGTPFKRNGGKTNELYSRMNRTNRAATSRKNKHFVDEVGSSSSSQEYAADSDKNVPYIILDSSSSSLSSSQQTLARSPNKMVTRGTGAETSIRDRAVGKTRVLTCSTTTSSSSDTDSNTRAVVMKNTNYNSNVNDLNPRSENSRLMSGTDHTANGTDTHQDSGGTDTYQNSASSINTRRCSTGSDYGSRNLFDRIECDTETNRQQQNMTSSSIITSTTPQVKQEPLLPLPATAVEIKQECGDQTGENASKSQQRQHLFDKKDFNRISRWLKVAAGGSSKGDTATATGVLVKTEKVTISDDDR